MTFKVSSQTAFKPTTDPVEVNIQDVTYGVRTSCPGKPGSALPSLDRGITFRIERPMLYSAEVQVDLLQESNSLESVFLL